MGNGANPASRDDAGRFKPGHSGNPQGRASNRALTTALEETIDKKKLAEKLWALALSGDMQAIKYIYDRIEGTPTQRHEFDVGDFIERLRAERPELDDEKLRFISERAQQLAETG